MDTFKQESFEHLASPEHLNRALTIVGIKGWFSLLFFVALTVITAIWAVMGSLPITVSGKAMMLDLKSSFAVQSQVRGVVKQVLVKTGDHVKRGQVVLVVGTTALTAPDEGAVVWIEVTQGEEVLPQQNVVWIEKLALPSDFKILGFFSLFSGQQIQPGMEARITLDTVSPERYGMVKGVVKEVLPYPIGLFDSYMQHIPSKSLKEYLIDGSLPTILVVIAPILNPAAPSGFQWTSKQGPPLQIRSGTVGEARVILENVRPISYVIPSLVKN